MENQINLSDLRPTRSSEHDPLPTLLTANIVLKLREQTSALLRHPYDPAAWNARARTLAVLGYPELASGDALRSVRLCQTMSQFCQSRLDKPWKLGSNRGFWMLHEESCVPEEPQEHVSRLQDLLTDLEIEAREISQDCTRYHGFQGGKYVPQAYPWLEERYRGRSASVMEDINEDLWKSDVKAPSGRPYIEVKRCALQPDEDIDSDSAALGIFTTCNIEKDTKILIDVTDLFGCIGPGTGNSRANLHGSEGCLQQHHPNLPNDDGPSLRWVRDRVGKHAADVLLLCRTLMSCVKCDLASPFDLPAIARLVPSYHLQNVRSFYLDETEIIYDALQQFGIDIFADHRYDTWVLFTISARLRNNSWTTPLAAALSPIFSLFNHSCEPNAEWQTKRDHRTIHVRVLRDVAAGEQLFVEYDSYAHEKPLEARRRHLAQWFERCMCSRCAREEREEQALLGMRADEDRERGDEDENSGGLGDATDDDGGNGGNSASGAVLPTWDVWEKPSLPEDSFWLSVA